MQILQDCCDANRALMGEHGDLGSCFVHRTKLSSSYVPAEGHDGWATVQSESAVVVSTTATVPEQHQVPVPCFNVLQP